MTNLGQGLGQGLEYGKNLMVYHFTFHALNLSPYIVIIQPYFLSYLQGWVYNTFIYIDPCGFQTHPQ